MRFGTQLLACVSYSPLWQATQPLLFVDTGLTVLLPLLVLIFNFKMKHWFIRVAVLWPAVQIFHSDEAHFHFCEQLILWVNLKRGLMLVIHLHPVELILLS